jgi:hypothetical protein
MVNGPQKKVGNLAVGVKIGLSRAEQNGNPGQREQDSYRERA